MDTAVLTDVSFGALLLLLAVRMPIGAALGIVSLAAFPYLASFEVALSVLRTVLPVRRQLGADGDPHVSSHGGDREPFGNCQGPVRGGAALARAAAGRARRRGQPRLGRVRRRLGLLHRGLGGDGADRGAGNAPLRLRQGARRRGRGERRHPCRADPALGDVRDLRRLRRGLDRQAPHRWHPSRPADGGGLHPDDPRALPA